MRILALDVSKNAPGFAVLDNEKRVDSGTLNTKLVNNDYPYPFDVYESAKLVAAMCFTKVVETRPQVVVVEQINLGRNRNTQRILEWIHMAFVDQMHKHGCDLKYMSSSTWRKLIDLKMSKDDKKNNSRLKNKEKYGIKGKITKKHLSVRWANARYGLNLKLKNNDEADALGLGHATYLAIKDKLNVFCDGTGI